MITVLETETTQSRLERASSLARQIESIACLIEGAAEEEIAIGGSASAVVRLSKLLRDELASMIDELTPVVRQWLERRGSN